MRILMISTDKKILENGSAAQKRHFEYGKICDELHIVVLRNANQRECEHEFTRIPPLPPPCKWWGQERIPLTPFQKGGVNDNVRIYGVAGRNKAATLWNGYKMAKDAMEGMGSWGLAVPSQSPSGTAARANKIDLVTTQDAGFTGLIGYFLKKKYGVKLNMQIHGEEEKLLNKILLFPFQKKIIKRADSIRVVSERLKKCVIGKYGVDAKKIYVIRIYSDSVEKLRNSPREIKQAVSRGEEIKKLAESEGDSHPSGEFHLNEFTILTVGRLVKVKNIKLQIEALTDVLKIFPNTKLLIVGDGHEKKHLEGLTSDLKIKGNVEFEGWQNKLSPFYDSADLFLLTSNAEGWGLAVIDAMAAGCPVIMTDVGCAGEVLRNEENGLVIPTGDKKALIAAICKMITGKGKREMFSKKGKEAVLALPNKTETLEMYAKMWT